MARFSFLVLLAAAFSGYALANPVTQQELVQSETPQVMSDKWSWSSCGHDSDPVQIQSIDISPDPPERGQNLTVTVKGFANKQIKDGAYADVVVKVGAIKLLQKEFDLCDEARNADAEIQCPVEEGQHEVTHSVALPREIPYAPFSVHIQGYTDEDEEMTCVDIKIDFRRRIGHLLGW
ncbi:hypothetical protein CERSUDRAFT_79775 [Gelatoporia subvermispora B]|uniref:Phosphatidylglycerol/phosphatidylinositol transfer protein n=1 Tax=Ceriporiopsis subvermispora (strain B) TaxID=914234 RepID=M2RTA9_CERS8|nr:hypothetical protein CERSUDRAFT_79775 [Gelatoporia subvermispora B]